MMTKRDVTRDPGLHIETPSGGMKVKTTRRSHKVRLAELPELTAKELLDIRQELKMSRAVFAMYLRTNARTLEGWEQGRARPNAQATALIRLVQKHPETVAQLAALS